ncbi:MAG: hypothetical protein JXR61_06935 [Prolixibacteraceae bacterium]|nr:hypothetical protein [Prolixibacteraceae bacterium]
MKKLIFTTAFLIVTILSNFAIAQSLDEILENHFKAVNQEKLMKTESIYIKAKVSQMGMDIPMEMKVKRPDKFAIIMELQGQKITQAFDGNEGWMIVPGMDEPQVIEGDMLDQLKQQPESMVESDFYNYKEKGSTVDFIGKVNVDSKEAFRIKLITTDGTTKDYFIDANTYLINKVKATVTSGGQSVDVEQNMTDYKIFDGMAMSTKIEQKTPVGNSTIEIEDVRFNENYDDAVFSKPSK